MNPVWRDIDLVFYKKALTFLEVRVASRSSSLSSDSIANREFEN
jgi:hypothetical protein